MPDGRCDLVLLGWTLFVGFNLVGDALWGGTASEGPGGAGGGRIGASTSELYRGEYWLQRNGSTVETGIVRVALSTSPTSLQAVQVSSLSLALMQKGRMNGFSSFDDGLVFSAVELGPRGEPRTMTASGAAGKLGPFGKGPCRLDAVVDFGGSGHEAGGAADDDAVLSQGEGPTDFDISGEIAAGDCGSGLQFRASAVDVPEFTRKVSHYSIWVNLLTIFQIRFYLTQMRYTEDGPSAAKVSIVCVGMQALMDAYDSFLHLCLGLSAQYMFNTIAVVSLLKFVLFSLLEARYLLVIWRQRHLEAFNQGWAAMRRELSWLYSRFYGILVVGLLLVYNSLDRLDSIVLFFQACWIPQILHDAWQGSRGGLSPAFVIGMAVTRTLFVVYLWGCPAGIFNGDLYPVLPNAPSTSMCAAVVTLQSAQVLFILSQRKLGARWFVPWVCMPWAYNYNRHARLEPGTDCVICMTELDPEDARPAITPCNHQFHRACLEQWMDVKMECPTCRATLPPMQ
mmetsp:Transcript_75526/g.213979  ORF Transcript_75526/g.213979 Transcript_75526/m.213979 type:complete len:510 (-) Transcript_75526:120-1649(-)